jgi:hypothetical protein
MRAKKPKNVKKLYCQEQLTLFFKILRIVDASKVIFTFFNSFKALLIIFQKYTQLIKHNTHTFEARDLIFSDNIQLMYVKHL